MLETQLVEKCVHYFLTSLRVKKTYWLLFFCKWIIWKEMAYEEAICARNWVKSNLGSLVILV